MIREAIDDLRRRKRDQDVNNQMYSKITQFGGEKSIASSAIKVGDFITVEKVVGFSSASLFPARKREAVTQGGTIESGR